MITVRYIFNPLDPQKVEVSHVFADGQLAPCDLYPGDGLHKYAVYLNGREIVEAAQEIPFKHSDTVSYVRVPGVTGAAALTLAQTSAFGAFALGAAKVLGIVALNFAIQRLLGPSRRPLTAEDSNSPTYRFGGITSNRNAEGAPIPVIYGEHDTGGLEIAKYTTVTSEGETLYVLLLLSEGPITSVGGRASDGDNLSTAGGNLPEGIRINGQSASNYDDVTAYVRLGNDEQSSIPGFEAAVLQDSVGQTLTESNDPGPDQVELPTGVYDPTDTADAAELDKWDTAVTYDMGDAADAFSLILGFPQGLYATNAGGLTEESVRFQARYRRLVGGSPVGDVVVLPAQTLVNNTSSTFATEFRRDFFDPATFQPGTPGRYLFIPSSGTAAISSVSGFAEVAAPAFTLTVVAWLRQWPTGSNGWQVQQVNANGGWRMRFVRTISGTPELQVSLGSGSAFTLYSFPTPGLSSTTDFFMVAFSYRGDSTTGELRFAVNSLTGSNNNTVRMEPPYGANLNLGVFSLVDTSIDDLRVFQTFMGGPELVGFWNGGTGFYSTGDETNLIASVDFDAITLSTAVDKSPNGNDVALGGGATVASGQDGVVVGATVGEQLRDTYRIEVQRLDEDDEDQLGGDQIDFEAIKLITYQTFRYPGRALLGLRIRATDQLNGGAPTITTSVEGRPCPIWDGANPTLPTYIDTFTRNPAWIAVDALVNAEYGLGDFHDRTRDIDVAAFQELADYADELVDKGDVALDLSQGSTFAFTYTAGAQPTVSLEWLGIDDFPIYKVGDFIAIKDGTGALSTWNTNDKLGIEITSVSFVASTGTLSIEGNWPTAQSAPAALSPSGSIGPEVLVVREPRFQFDGIFDRPNADGWESVVQILQTARSTPVRFGNRVSVFVDRPREAVALITMGNIVEGSFSSSYSGIRDRANAVAIEILDREAGYDRRIVEREHPTLTELANQDSFRRRRLRREGVTRRSQALREAVYQLNVAFLLRRSVEFQLDVDGIPLQPGDRIKVAHDVPQWGFSGRLRGAADASTIQLDRPVTLESGSSYEVTVQNGGDGSFVARGITMAPGTYAAGASITLSTALPFVPTKDDLYSFGETAESVKDFVVTSVDMDPSTLQSTIQAIEYNEGVYDDGFGDILESPSALPVPSAEDQIPDSALALSASEGADENQDGTSTQIVTVSWVNSPDTASSLTRNEIWLRDESIGAVRKVAELSGSADFARIADQALVRGGSYTVFVRAVGRNGRARAILDSPSVPVSIRGFTDAPGAPVSLSSRVAGDRAVYAWNGIPDRRSVEVHIRSGGWILGQRIGEGLRGSTELGPTSNWVTAPTNADGKGNPDLFTRSRSGTGQFSSALISPFEAVAPGEVLEDFIAEDLATPFDPAVVTLAGLGAPTPGAKELRFSGATTEGSIQVDIDQLDTPEWVFLHISWEAYQLHDATWDDLDFSWGDADGQRWTWEGPVPTDVGENNTLPRINLATTTDGTTPNIVQDRQAYDPGLYYLRDARIRLTFQRPDRNKDVSLTRFNVRVVRPQPDRQGGATFPTAPVDGQRFWRTDLREFFVYDANRGKWLGDNLYEFKYLTLSVITNAYFAFEDTSFPGSATVGYTAPHDLVCVGVTGRMATASTNTIQVHDDGTTVASVINISSTSARVMTINSPTIAAGSAISLYALGSQAASHYTVYCRRIAT